MPEFSTIVLAVKILWCLMAFVTFTVCVSVWWPMLGAATLAARRTSSPAVRNWLLLPVRLSGGLAWVALCNLAAGLLSVSIPSRAEVFTLPTSWTSWVALLVPCLFIVSAAIKLHISIRLRDGYSRIVNTVATEATTA